MDSDPRYVNSSGAYCRNGQRKHWVEASMIRSHGYVSLHNAYSYVYDASDSRWLSQ